MVPRNQEFGPSMDSIRDHKSDCTRPVIIFGADFAHKDGCTVFEKKLLGPGQQGIGI